MSWWRSPDSPLACGLQLAGLWSVAVAQPLLSALADNAHFFVARKSQPTDIAIATALVLIAGPLALWLLESAVGVVSRAARGVLHLALIAGLAGVMAQFIAHRGLGLPSTLAIATGALLGGAFAFGFARLRALRTLAALLSLLAPVLAAVFLSHDKIASITWLPSEVPVAHATRAPDTPVFVIVLDELPLLSLLDDEGQLDPQRAPHLTRFAERATWFRNASTVADNTAYAVPPILTGRRSEHRVLATFPNHPESLFTLLAPTHRVLAREEVTALCPRSVCLRVQPPLRERLRAPVSDIAVLALRVLLPAEATTGLPPVDDRWANFARVIQETSPADHFEWFAEQIPTNERALLGYLHVLTPHSPWEHLPSGQRFGPPAALRRMDGIVGIDWSETPAFANRAYQRHLLEVAYADRLFGELMAVLDAKGLYDPALIVVVADHGVSFEPGEPRRKLTEQNHAEIMAIPLLIKQPGQPTGAVDERRIETIDILPTIADLLDIALPWPVEGVSAFAADRPARLVQTTMQTMDGVALTFESLPSDIENALRVRRERFGATRPVDAYLPVGPHPELLGRSFDPGGSETRASPRIHLDRADSFAAIDLSAPEVPLFVAGRLEAAPPAGSALDLALAVAVDGVIRVTTTPYRSSSRRGQAGSGTADGPWVFTALLPDGALGPGRNDIDILAIHPGPDGARLVPLHLAEPAGGRTPRETSR
jgi:hypothetical protein